MNHNNKRFRDGLLREFIFLSFLTLICGMTSFARSNTIDNEIHSILEQHKTRPFNGVILVAKADQILYENQLGHYGDPKLNNQFVIGSVSKQFCAVVILKLVDQGLIKLNAPIKKYLPETAAKSIGQVTIKQLLNHTSGISIENEPLRFQPGTQFQYSPTQGYYLLSRIAERVTNRDYTTFLSGLFHQASMPHTAFAESRNLSVEYKRYPHLVHGFKEVHHTINPTVQLDEGIDQPNGTWRHPGGGVISTAGDLLRWNIALHQKKSLLSLESYTDMNTSSAVRDNHRYGSVGYGFGLQILDSDGIVEMSHSGYIDGYMTTLIYYPKTQISLIILENIAWDVADVSRAFAVHDALRQLIRHRSAELKSATF